MVETRSLYAPKINEIKDIISLIIDKLCLKQDKVEKIVQIYSRNVSLYKKKHCATNSSWASACLYLFYEKHYLPILYFKEISSHSGIRPKEIYRVVKIIRKNDIVIPRCFVRKNEYSLERFTTRLRMNDDQCILAIRLLKFIEKHETIVGLNPHTILGVVLYLCMENDNAEEVSKVVFVGPKVIREKALEYKNKFNFL